MARIIPDLSDKSKENSFPAPFLFDQARIGVLLVALPLIVHFLWFLETVKAAISVISVTAMNQNRNSSKI